MLRHDHGIMIEQGDKWTTIKLRDKEEFDSKRSVKGTWKHTSNSYNDKEILFTSDNPQYLYWEWKGSHAGTISIGSKMARASHKAGEDQHFQVLITLSLARRTASGKFEVESVANKSGTGQLTYNVNPHFTKGAILWTPIRYERK